MTTREYLELKSIPNDSNSQNIVKISTHNPIIDGNKGEEIESLRSSNNNSELNSQNTKNKQVQVSSSRSSTTTPSSNRSRRRKRGSSSYSLLPENPYKQRKHIKRKRQSSISSMNNPRSSAKVSKTSHKPATKSNLQRDFERLLQKQITKKSEWDAIYSLIQDSKVHATFNETITSIGTKKDNKLHISQYNLYQMLSQKTIPVTPQIVKSVLSYNPKLAQSKDVYPINVFVAFENHSSMPETLFQLISMSDNPVILVYNVLHNIIHRDDHSEDDNLDRINTLILERLLHSVRRHTRTNGFDSIPEANIRVLIHQNFRNALYLLDDNGNTLLHQACIKSKLPRIVRLIVEGMMNDVGWWCIFGNNEKFRTPFHLTLSSQASYLEISSILGQLLSVIPLLDLPSRCCIVHNDVLHACIRTENVHLMFQILRVYPDLIHVWSAEGTLPFHDICRYGSSETIEEFIDMFRKDVRHQSLMMTKESPKFLPVQIACVNHSVSVDIINQLIRILSEEKPGVPYNELIQVYGFLHLVAATSNVAVAKFLLSLCPQALTNTNRFQSFGPGPSPLFYACVRGSPSMIEYLFHEGKRDRYHPFQHGGLIDSISGNELHPIRALCSNHRMTHASMIKLLIDSKISSDWICENKLLNSAAYEGNLEVATALVEHCPRLLRCKDEEGNTPLHDACTGGDSGLIEFLVARTTQLCCKGGFLIIDHNLCGMLDRNRIGLTPWDLICEMLETLFANCDLDPTSYAGIVTAAMMTLVLDAAMSYVGNEAESSPVSVCRTVFESVINPPKMIPLPIYHSAITRVASITLLENFIVQNYFNCDPLQLDNYGRTALHVAMELQRPEEDWSGIVCHLLYDEENGSEECTSIRDDDGRYVLHVASESGLSWFGGLRDIFHANEKIVEHRDDVTGMFPFMLAASAYAADLNAIYSLLLKCPSALTMS